ncbi:MAG: hypothetical protein D6732_04290 [Methanobacteriota archaeon]|nr:MAG: hypothetical protein D6732_04290 [Euryarchaeota archaeon]
MGYHLIITIAIIFLLMIVWFGIQFVERRIKNLPSDCDVMEGRRGCLGCFFSGHCKKLDQKPGVTNSHPLHSGK